MHSLLAKMRGVTRRSPRYGWLIFIVIVIVLITILPPILRAIKDLAKTGGSLADFVKNAVGGVGETGSRLLASLGIGKSPYADKLKYYLNPPANDPWNVDFWRSGVNAAQAAQLEESFDYYVPGVLSDLSHWYGHDVDEIKEKLAEWLPSQLLISYLNYWCLKNKGKTFVRWMNTGIWCKLSDKDTVEVCDYALTFPYDLPENMFGQNG